MSSFLISSRPFESARWFSALSFVPNPKQTTWGKEPLKAIFSRVDNDKTWGPATDPVTGVTLAIAGRVSLEKSNWLAADKLGYTGGIAARYLLECWLSEELFFHKRLNGAFCVFVHDPRNKSLHLFTDRMGVFPVYRAKNTDFCLCSHPDVLADYLSSINLQPEIDILTISEVLATGTSAHPHTYYRQIEQLEPASHYIWSTPSQHSFSQVTAETYWTPKRHATGVGNLNSLAEQLSDALKSAGKRRSEVLGKNGLLLSGGADSRAILFAMEHPKEVHSVTFCDHDNSEVSTARAIARIANSNHEILFRSPEHYGEGAWETVRVTGGMWCIQDAHYDGFKGHLDDMRLGNLMTGCYTDYLFKGLGYNKREKRFFGKRLSLDELAPYALEYYHHHSPISPDWQMLVNNRLTQWISNKSIDNYQDDPFFVEDKRVRPLSREADAMGRLYLLRTQPWDPLMVDNELIDLFGCIPPSQKINSRVFRSAVSKLLPSAASKILNNNDFSPLNASEPERVLRYLARKTYAMTSSLFSNKKPNSSLLTDDSWPSFVYYIANSKVLKELWGFPTPSQHEIFTNILGYDPWKYTLLQWAERDRNLILRLLTLKIWLMQRKI